MLIDSVKNLEHMCNNLLMLQPKFIAIDTEFIRNSSEYYPRLCLMQVAYGREQFVIDVLASDMDLSPLNSILYNKNIVKVFHDCRQDIDALLTKFPKIPNPIFDTQVAAMFCYCYENAVGYSRLVEQFLGISLDKLSLKRSNWMLRPLSPDKIQYALNDVIYLHELYQILYDNLVDSGKLLWFLEEMDNIVLQELNYSNVCDIPDLSSDITREEIIVVKSVIEWREKLAQFFNLNRELILRNKVMLSLIKDFIRKSDISTLSKYIKKEYLTHGIVADLLEIINNNQDVNVDELYNIDTNYNQSILNVLLILLCNLCYKNNISQKLVTSKGSLIKLLNGKFSYVMKGWRYEFFGCEIEKFMQGKSKIIVSAQVLDNNFIDIMTTLTDM
ncbi:ribonuclease D [Ehrlichia canis]|uniref:3'-5' exonuclease n=1 Tax=Ehrlichia canis (strain Jake) TaxID=269484 RepID=A0ACA6AWD8_EHRCJ|nr:ribonuclease D [Ehrlichia canis]AAZ68735.1 3'-5' exonuclease [Ehrlichia canis str. Jake]AUO54535.1 ribonuclease D [Ehrlichia canis]UKC53229.1 ribonuclease D [Ehrlichia canis]UKC54166.1 ribonuclease D [Ehrlichia canis]UKC55102.1 ribonuclease D [Ehrlichia canis]